MTLSPGARVGVYEVASILGAGGMGEVYRARDPRLGRDVALKILPDLFASHPERPARFRREAQVLAALNHPNIASIHGLEESEGVRVLVLELVEGETLADRIAQGPIPVSEAMPIARQIAEALEAAREQAIVHRDLKPANIKLTPAGVVKVLDFGLAKLNDPSGSNASSAPNALPLPPTITTPAATGLGVILGTRQGKETAIGAEPRAYLYPRLSPDGTRIAVDAAGENRDVWVWDLARNAMTRLTTDPTLDRSPAWMPDSRRIVFMSDRGGLPMPYWQSAGSVGEAEQLTDAGDETHFAHSISPDGRHVLLRRGTPGIASELDVYLLALDGDLTLQPLIRGPFRKFNAEISPDGRWLAYQTDASGRFEVVVRPFPKVNSGQWRARDGRFLMLKAAGVADSAAVGPHLVVVKNRFEELNRRVPPP